MYPQVNTVMEKSFDDHRLFLDVAKKETKQKIENRQEEKTKVSQKPPPDEQ
jgi:hypothetical protein